MTVMRICVLNDINGLGCVMWLCGLGHACTTWLTATKPMSQQHYWPSSQAKDRAWVGVGGKLAPSSIFDLPSILRATS